MAVQPPFMRRVVNPLRGDRALRRAGRRLMCGAALSGRLNDSRFGRWGRPDDEPSGLIVENFEDLLGRRLCHRRRQLGLTQAQVGKAVGVSFQTIQKYECGAARMSVTRLWQLSTALSAPLDYFFEGIEHIVPHAKPPTGARRWRGRQRSEGAAAGA